MSGSESSFSKPVEYTDIDGQVKVIPQGFKEVLDHIDSLPKNEDTINQIETFMVKLKEMVAWNEERKRKEQELGKSPIKCDCVCHTVYRNSSGNLNHIEDDCHCGGRPNL